MRGLGARRSLVSLGALVSLAAGSSLAALSSLAVFSSLAVPSLAAQDEPISVRLSSSSASARVGETGEVLAIVDVDASARGPLLVTPTSDGPAIEVVRGRLLRADAEDPRVTPLRFHVPFVASSPGDAVVRVRVDGWSCVSSGEGQPERCHTVRTEAAITLTVRAL